MPEASKKDANSTLNGSLASSAANLIVTDGNTLLHDDLIEKLVLLRINRDFIKYMRATYKNVSKNHALFKHKQQFGMTVVKD